jgi:hypothetical protein
MQKTTLHNKLFILGLLFILLSCSSQSLQKSHTLEDFVNQSDSTLIDTNRFLTFDEFIKEYDTIPVGFGYQIFNEIIDPIPIDSSIFKRLWNWNIDTIECVMAKKTNIRLDPRKNLSDESYFFVIEFITADSLPIAATFFIDFKNEKIGTYSIANDSFKYVRQENDIIKVKDIKDKLILYWH